VTQLYPVHEPKVISGHPEQPLLNDAGNLISMLTVCAQCGALRTILFLTADRWYCSACRFECNVPPKLFPVA
jgi:ribosomal protein S27AE